jgi:TPR repeat protein
MGRSGIGALFVVLVLVASCGGGEPAKRAALTPPPAPGAAEVARTPEEAPPPPAEPAAPADAGAEPATSPGFCDAGSAEACLAQNEAAFKSGNLDVAIIGAYALCEKGIAEGCLRAAHYMDRKRIRSKFGTTADALRERGLSHLETQCSTGGADGCFHLGKLRFEGTYTTADVPGGLAQLDTACDGGSAGACWFLANAYASGVRVAKDAARALKLLEKACDAGGAAGCALLGDKLARTDATRAAALYEKACAGDDATGCARSGEALEARGDHALALDAFVKACDIGLDASCADAAALLAAGRGVTADPARARALHTIACDADVARGCHGLAALVAGGLGGDRNWGEGVALYEKACTLGVTAACKEAKRLAKHPPDWTCTTVIACEARCNERLGQACAMLGQLVAAGGDDDFACHEAEEPYERGCTYGDAASCLWMGNATAAEGEAATWYGQACRLGAAEACLLRDLALQTAGDEAEQEQAARSLQQACTRKKSVAACVYVGEMIEAKEPAKARKLWTAACKQKDGRACRLLAYQLGAFSGGGATSSGSFDLSDAERREAAAAHEEGLRLLEQGCDLDDVQSCATLVDLDDGAATAWQGRVDQLVRRDPCGAYVRSGNVY